MRTGIEIYGEGSKGKNVWTEGAAQESSNYCHVVDERSATRKIRNSSCSYRRNQQQSVHRSEEVPSQPDEMQNNNLFKKRRLDGSTESLFDRLPEDILHDILSRLSICDLLTARRTCVAWHRIISLCDIFQQLYDERNRESWVALTGHNQNPNDFWLFNNSNKYFFFKSSVADQTTTWLLNGAADGLLLFVTSEGKMVVSNALTRRFRLLPDPKVSPRLRLNLCLKRKLWGIDSKTMSVQPSVSMNIVVDRASKTFKVMVWGELRTNQVHALVYSSAIDTWTTKLCSDIDYKIFRQPFHSTVNGNTIYFASMHGSVLAYYNTETGVFVHGRMMLLLHRILGRLVKRVRYIKIMVYRAQIFLLGIIVACDFNLWHDSCAFVGLWQANHTRGQWELLTARGGLESPTADVAVAYDGNKSVLIIQRIRGSKMIFLNLDTKVWRMSATTDGNARRQQQEMIPSSPAFRAFYLKLKFRTAL